MRLHTTEFTPLARHCNPPCVTLATDGMAPGWQLGYLSTSVTHRKKAGGSGWPVYARALSSRYRATEILCV
jgi:hypothetical protein